MACTIAGYGSAWRQESSHPGSIGPAPRAARGKDAVQLGIGAVDGYAKQRSIIHLHLRCNASGQRVRERLARFCSA
ncbi:hypothetical protein G6F21_014753 [Rhizopus arrhizus]|nr:hypothetical protein G6F24_018504 [Rhizopus arrhizus]KAG0771348.1 hypothetical protein G6F21_014753 [Rhizopus arrhizus]KAG1389138.1 hypothetical protein G6F58_013357 [Rhizopus delemar]